MKRKKLFLSALAIITAFSLMIPSFAADPSFAPGETGMAEESEAETSGSSDETETDVPETPGETEIQLQESENVQAKTSPSNTSR